MNVRGRIDICGEFPKPWTDEVVRGRRRGHHDGLRRRLPGLPGKCYQDWDIEDPQGLAADAIHPSRDGIERRVLLLLGEPGVPAHG